MTISTDGSTGTAGSADARRAGRELLLEFVFRPLSNLLVPALVRLRVAPPAVVVANAVVGLVAALALALDDMAAAALLVQVKTLLDNADGQLARATGRVTVAGRYLDTIADLVVNAALFVALGYVTGQPVLAAVGFLALTFVLAVDFNVSELYREAQGFPTVPPVSTGTRTERALESAYGLLFAPLDRIVRRVGARRGTTYDGLTVAVLANLGLTTQLAVLGLVLLLGAPAAYMWFVSACLVALVPLQIRAERRSRATLA